MPEEERPREQIKNRVDLGTFSPERCLFLGLKLGNADDGVIIVGQKPDNCL